MKKVTLFMFITLFTSMVFAGRAIELQKKAVTKANISAWVSKVKDKGKKFDFTFHLKNKGEKFVIVMLHDITCYRGKKGGVVKHTFFNTGERTIDLMPNQLKKFKMLCKIGEKSQGKYKIVVKSIYSNPSRDGKHTGKEVAKNLTWVYDPDKQ